MNKKAAAFLLAGVMAFMGTGIPAHAAEAGGSSTVTYSPGKATGTNPDGTLADWTVDYPVKVVLNDSNTNYASGATLKFSLWNTDDFSQPYDKAKTVHVYAKGHPDYLNDSFRGKLKMYDSHNTLQENVQMQIGKSASNNVQFSKAKVEVANHKEEVFTLNSTSKTNSTLKAFLNERSGAKDGESYHQSVTWYFSDNQN